ncbi:FAD-binding oxidoreductase [Halobacillus halophilus]|uniref:D-amino-acid dehydrogenase n=1 Tax=Halobacillus halophilus (strain ATCC 35676 / DSM 2266 / JCM 20832 / KCTC 3685 / LMG 17431 / NBRC 102448 / NCIMB 2269) TaxID=866895 RepID=I0JNJ2_HALH3|nr:FAD-dependent oxidoreductase [Halobacillus halophilus]ASF39770.1 FAD-binding oxidoreductase [Halobacillus halophilus]CCG45712.1 D-amino-acid dehydrogenase [Halobacillus halophilus DSM 2266]
MKHIIIGAGIVGASTAYHLSRRGEEVLIVDRKDKGQATRAAAGIICPWLTNRSNKAWYHLVMEGAKYYPFLIKELENLGLADTGYKQVGAINIFDTEEKLDRKMEVALERRQQSPEMGDITKLTPTQTKAMFPPVADHYRALHISGAAKVDGEAVSQALLSAAEMNGAVFNEGEVQLVHNGDASARVLVDDEHIEADQVIVTNGAWAKQLFASYGLNTNVTYEKAQIVHLQVPEKDTDSWPVMLPPFNHYMLTFDNGKLVIGATKENREDFETDVTMGAVHQLLNKALKVAPGLAEAAYIQTKVGFRPFTPGSLPVIGRVPGLTNVWMANGLGASGLTSGPYVGSILASLAAEEQVEINLDDYDPSNAF